MTDPIDIARLRALDEAATPAPWVRTADHRVPVLGPPRITRKGDGTPKPRRGTEARVVYLDNTAGCGDEACCADDPFVEVSPADADLIVGARNALPALLDEVERLTRERDGARALLTESVGNFRALGVILDATKEHAAARRAEHAAALAEVARCVREERQALMRRNVEAQMSLIQDACDATDAALASGAAAGAHMIEEAEERGAQWALDAVGAIVNPYLVVHQIRTGSPIDGLPLNAADIVAARRNKP